MSRSPAKVVGFRIRYTGRSLRRPLIGIAVFVAAGIWLAASGRLAVDLAFMLASSLIVLSCALLRTHCSSTLVFCSIAGVAACRFLIASPAVSSAYIDHELPNLPMKGVEVVGRISGFPVHRPYRSGRGGMWTFPLRVEGINNSNGWETRRGVIDVRILGCDPEPIVQYGQRVLLQGDLQERSYPGGQPIGLKVSNERYCIELSDALRFSPMLWCRNWRMSAARALEEGLEDMPMQKAVLKALVLGYRNEIPPETYAGFRRTGSLHIFAISGLHVGIVGLLLAVALKSVGIPRDWFGAWLMPLLFLYVVATGMKASALRAMLMAGVYLLAPLFRRKPDVPTSVAFAAVLLLMWNPMELLNAGFVFSFVVVTFIVMAYSILPDRLLKGSWLKVYILSLVITSLAASLASIPLTTFYFGRFSPIALLGNLVVVPLTFCIVLTGWLAILIPVASEIFNHASVVFINAMVQSVEWLDRIPGSSWKVDHPPLMSILLWYGSLIYLFTHAKRHRQRIYAMVGVVCSMVWGALA